MGYIPQKSYLRAGINIAAGGKAIRCLIQGCEEPVVLQVGHLAGRKFQPEPVRFAVTLHIQLG